MSIELIALVLLGLIVLALLAVASVLGLGLYFGWFSIGSANSASKDDFRFTVDADRVRRDQRTVQTTGQDLGGQAKDKAAIPVKND